MSSKRSPAARQGADVSGCLPDQHNFMQLTHWGIGQQTLGMQGGLGGVGQMGYGTAKLVCTKCGKVITV